MRFADPEGGQGGPDPPEILKGNELLNGVSLAGRCWPAFSGIWILSPLKEYAVSVAELDPIWQNFLDPRLKWQYIDAKPAGAFLERVQVCRPDV